MLGSFIYKIWWEHVVLGSSIYKIYLIFSDDHGSLEFNFLSDEVEERYRKMDVEGLLEEIVNYLNDMSCDSTFTGENCPLSSS